MPFALNEEQTLIADAVDRLLSDHRATGNDDEQIWPKLAELGLLGAALPAAVGGSDGGPTELMIVGRCLGRHLITGPWLGSMALGASLLHQLEDQIRLPLLADGSKSVAVAMFEQASRYDWQRSQCLLTGREGGRVINGSKHYVMDEGLADWLIVTARDQADDDLVLLFLERDTAGLNMSRYPAFDESSLATLRMTELPVAESAILARGDRVRDALNNALAMARLAASAQILGACEAVFPTTLDYLRVREQFGKPLSRFQALQHRASELHADIEMLRSMVMGAAESLTRGFSDQSRADATAAMAMAGPIGDRVGCEAIQLHGAIGMTYDLGVGRYLMRINALSRVLGDGYEMHEQYLGFLQQQSQLGQGQAT